ncbi:hypothetical protein TRFO_04766 [Tritrichomonas foetus]|uniref:Phospholipase C/D domain-containing protein n=1 Tax=Tritrichomonas foetus TaxID=1144522 RepID=A0A1J4KCN2_9EUKA|nr:hypothetical protein TRFO_04766 [Tritrichomonas foetus]|eukprot:OHT08696.1 hypothetical protein TRFO_04766 [Tritrichomonas foetus]
MCFLLLLANYFTLCSSWGPIFHQVLGQEFAEEYLSHLTPEQTSSFIKGSVYVDGLSRRLYHDLSNLVSLLNEYSNSSLEYYFVLGFILHMAVDSSGHIGFPLSYLPLKRPVHYLAELTCCSALMHDRKPPSIDYDDVCQKVYMRTRNGTSFYFHMFYKVWRIIAKFPVYKLLSYIENDSCKEKCGGKYAMCNLELHILTIKRLMFDCLLLLNEGKLTNEKLGEISRKELESFQCCL